MVVSEVPAFKTIKHLLSICRTKQMLPEVGVLNLKPWKWSRKQENLVEVDFIDFTLQRVNHVKHADIG